MPYRVITDQGTQFRSELFKNIGVICGFKVCTTTSTMRIFRETEKCLGSRYVCGRITETNGSVTTTKNSPTKPSQKHFVHKDFHNSTHVFIRVDRVKKALEPPCDGPFPVAKRYDKYFTVKIKGKDINISVDRLKPAYLLSTDGDNPDHFKQLEHAPTLPEKKLIVQRKIEKQPPDLLKKMSKKQLHALVDM
ncbi:transposon Tf2-11 polyprotein [Trichonephila clavipes]|nr:transposon Tf2-11 polyprotein [Trichonephila clavipes]